MGMRRVYDRILGDTPARFYVHTPYICMVLANPIAYTVLQACTHSAERL